MADRLFNKYPLNSSLTKVNQDNVNAKERCQKLHGEHSLNSPEQWSLFPDNSVDIIK